MDDAANHRAGRAPLQAATGLEAVTVKGAVDQPLTRRTDDPMFIDLSTGCRHKS
jgi:hypothetical protein